MTNFNLQKLKTKLIGYFDLTGSLYSCKEAENQKYAKACHFREHQHHNPGCSHIHEASLGLRYQLTAVIIGAMLILAAHGPYIIGMGLAVGIQDFRPC